MPSPAAPVPPVHLSSVAPSASVTAVTVGQVPTSQLAGSVPVRTHCMCFPLAHDAAFSSAWDSAVVQASVYVVYVSHWQFATSSAAAVLADSRAASKPAMAAE